MPNRTHTAMLDRLASALNAVGTAWIFALMLLVCADVLCRFLVDAPIRGVTEISAFSVVAIVFLQLPSSVRARRLIRADFMIERLHRSQPIVAAAMEVVIALIGAIVFAAILWSSTGGLAEAWQRNDSFGAEQVFTFPKWPIWLIVAVGSACALVALVAQIVVDAIRLRQARSGPPEQP